MEYLTVSIPHGLKPGDALKFDLLDGTPSSVTLPAGSYPGMSLILLHLRDGVAAGEILSLVIKGESISLKAPSEFAAGSVVALVDPRKPKAPQKDPKSPTSKAKFKDSLKCRLLGALINAGRQEAARFKMQQLGTFDFRPDRQWALDRAPNDVFGYYTETLSRFKDVDVELFPLDVSSDGSCQVHAISRSLVGLELFFDALRLDMHIEMRANESWYKAYFTPQIEGMAVEVSDQDWAIEWGRLLDDAKVRTPPFNFHPF